MQTSSPVYIYTVLEALALCMERTGSRKRETCREGQNLIGTFPSVYMLNGSSYRDEKKARLALSMEKVVKKKSYVMTSSLRNGPHCNMHLFSIAIFCRMPSTIQLTAQEPRPSMIAQESFSLAWAHMGQRNGK